MTAQQLVEQFAARMGVAGLALDAHGCAALESQQGVTVNLEHDAAQDLLHLYSHLGADPARDRETLYAAMLDANLFGQGTGGATLARDPQDRMLVLCQTVAPASLTGETFESLVLAFMDNAQQWRERLSETGTQDTAAAEAPAAPLGIEASLMMRV